MILGAHLMNTENDLACKFDCFKHSSSFLPPWEAINVMGGSTSNSEDRRH